MNVIVDVSSNNGPIDFHALKKQGVFGVYVKATEGATFNSPTLGSQFHAAKDAGLEVGCYHFARQDLSHSAATEAMHFVSAMKSMRGHGHACKKGDLIPVLDFEVGMPDKLYSAWRNAFQRTVMELCHHRTMLYTYPAFNVWNPPFENAQGLLWIADYNGHPNHPRIPVGYKHYDLHQFTDRMRFRQGRFKTSITLDASILPHPTHLHRIRCHRDG